jgi:S1-C subfamily serine protease
MYESIETKKKSLDRIILVVVAIGVATMFIAGYFIGGSVNSLATSTTTKSSSQQSSTLVTNSTTAKVMQNITYYYDTISLAQLYNDVKNSVVVITGYTLVYSFFGRQYSSVQGSGFVYDYNNEMVIITNKHVVNDAENITVTFSNGNGYPAMVMGSDAYSDLAVLSVDAPLDEFQPLEMTSSSTLEVGDPVIAIGSPFGLGGTLTAGIISQLGRTIQESTAGSYPIADIIQTSAAINPGNSGGPLLNYEGDVIGITTAIISDSNSLGFAVPSNTILREIGSLITTGSYDKHSWVGISGTDMSYEIAKTIGTNITYGWLITQVTSGGAAADAGLQGGNQQVGVIDQYVTVGGDIIIAVDGTRVINGDTFMSYLEEHTTPNQTITLTIVRNNHIQDVSVILKQRPAQS